MLFLFLSTLFANDPKFLIKKRNLILIFINEINNFIYEKHKINAKKLENFKKYAIIILNKTSKLRPTKN